MKKKSGYLLIIPLLLVLLFTGLGFLTFFSSAENSIYDLLLHIKPAVAEDPSILLLDIDDPAIARVGVWPWSRDIMADGLILMKEMGARYTVFDIEYTEKSPLGVNSDMLKGEIPETFSREFRTLSDSITDLFSAIQQGYIQPEEAGDYIAELTALSDDSRAQLLAKVNSIARDNDSYLGAAAGFFGRAFFTVNMLPVLEGALTEEHKTEALSRIALNTVTEAGEAMEEAGDIRPVISPILRGAAGAGFPNVTVDKDGVMRRISLFKKYDGHYFPQLVMAPLLDSLGSPKVEVSRSRVLIKDARFPDGTAGDISIPLTENQTMLINWPPKDFLTSFRHMSYYELVLNKSLEDRLIENLKTIDQAGYLAYYRGDTALLDLYRYAEQIKTEILENAGGNAADADTGEYSEVRDYFFEQVGVFLDGEARTALLNDIDAVLASPDVGESVKSDYRRIKEEIPGNFEALKDVYISLTDSRDRLKKTLARAFCIIGQTGTSTTDIGVNPFEEEYMNVGIHAATLNTVLSGQFLDDRPWYLSSLLALILALPTAFFIRKLKPAVSVSAGFVVTVLTALGMAGFFLITGIYLNILMAVLSLFFTVILIFIINFLSLEKEKSFLRNAFGHYLSMDVINDLISNPEKLNLGGEKKRLTALFTDVKGFSTISEQLDPTDLVKLLNAYLTEMSNIILDLRGTIDKYEGDAIISFFGAPVEYGEHSAHACLSAVRMKRVEAQLNERFLREKMSPSALFTRIGINTGEMVVGNMGTPQKMDYTIMGNSVNLAARLEGVNKQYGTGILVSEETLRDCEGQFAVRKLDRVRVVGIRTPVRLFELVEEKGALAPAGEELLAVFHAALDLFEQKDWTAAQKEFRRVLEIDPADGPAQTYLERCTTYLKKPPKKDWDGVFNLTTK